MLNSNVFRNMDRTNLIKTSKVEIFNFNFSGEQSKVKLTFDDKNVCKSFLLGCCPHDLLLTTVS